MKILGIVPARFASTRFPGKPLADINGKTMISRVLEQAASAQKLTRVVVATDDERILSHVAGLGGEAVITSPEHQSGTDRCAEVMQQLGESNWDVVINIQGDEPYIHPEQIDLLCSTFEDSNTSLSTLVKKISSTDELFNHNNVKVILNKRDEAIYFSRSPIPYNRNFPEQEWLKHSTYFKHIGIYGYRTATLMEVSRLAKTNLEVSESLEQLRWIENGYTIKAGITSLESIAIDTPEDVLKVKTL